MTSDLDSYLGISFPDPFSQLQASAVRLNELSSKANAHINDLENKLIALNLGIEYWSDRPLGLKELKGEHYAKHVLGFARVESAWCLAVREVRFEKKQIKYQAAKEEVVSFGVPIPIRKASRELRIEAVNKVNLESFLGCYQSHVSSRLDAYESSMT